MNRSLLRVVKSDAAPSEAELMRRAGTGDEQAFAALYDALAPIVFGITLRVVRDRALAEEVTQEVFVELWRVATRFDAKQGSVRGWTSTIAHRKAVDRVRAEQARRDREDRDHERSYSPSVDVVTEQIEQSIEQDQVQQALDDLTNKQREAVTMAYFGGRTYQEVAALLEVPEGTVKTRIRDGLIKLRDGIGRPR